MTLYHSRSLPGEGLFRHVDDGCLSGEGGPEVILAHDVDDACRHDPGAESSLGVVGAGLATTVFPPSRAGATLIIRSNTGNAQNQLAPRLPKTGYIQDISGPLKINGIRTCAS
jgi:hypothetical protein